MLVAEAAKLDETYIIVTAKILNVETAKLEKTDYEQMGVNAKFHRLTTFLANNLPWRKPNTLGLPWQFILSKHS